MESLDTPPQFNFWRVGNAFDTLIDYFVNVDASNVGLAASALQLFDGGKGGDWFDDFGWWGIAFLRAARHASLLRVDPTTCLNNSTICWQKMDDNAPLVWERADQQTFREAKPRFVGGCWNNYFSLGCDPLTGPGKLCGFQNTVTNGLYLVLAARYFQQTGYISYLTAAQREWRWFLQWFLDPSLHPDERLLDVYTAPSPTRMLVRERVSTYAFWNGKYPPVRAYDKNLNWAGDQGLILGAMVSLISILKDTSLYNFAIGILDGIQDRLVDDKGILQPWRPGIDFQGDSPDYSTGMGVYMRYLLYAFQQDTFLKQYILQTYQPFIQINAEAVCNSIKTCPPLPDGTSIEPMECWLNKLAVLNAAIVIGS